MAKLNLENENLKKSLETVNTSTNVNDKEISEIRAKNLSLTKEIRDKEKEISKLRELNEKNIAQADYTGIGAKVNTNLQEAQRLAKEDAERKKGSAAPSRNESQLEEKKSTGSGGISIPPLKQSESLTITKPQTRNDTRPTIAATEPIKVADGAPKKVTIESNSRSTVSEPDWEKRGTTVISDKKNITEEIKKKPDQIKEEESDGYTSSDFDGEESTSKDPTSKDPTSRSKGESARVDANKKAEPAPKATTSYLAEKVKSDGKSGQLFNHSSTEKMQANKNAKTDLSVGTEALVKQ